MRGRQRFFTGLPYSVYRERLITALPSADRKSDLDRDTITYATFEELFPNEKNSIRAIKKEYRAYFIKDVLQVLAKINYFASHSYYKAMDEEVKIIAPFLDKNPLSILLIRKNQRKALARQQLLASIRSAFLYSSDDVNAKKVFGNEKDFGKLIYRITDFMEDIDKDDNIDLSKWPDKKKLYINFARNLVFNEGSTFAFSISRYWYIFNKIAASWKHRNIKLKGLFSKATRTDYNYLLSVGFAIWGFYSEKERSKRLSEPHEFLFSSSYFRKTNETSRRKLLKGLRNLSAPVEYFREEFKKQKPIAGQHFSLNPFWRKPILHSEKDAYHIIDIKYLEERLTTGGFWFIFDQVTADNKLAADLKGKWGLLVEEYVNRLVKKTFPDKPKVVFSEIDGDKTGGVDLIIVYPDTLYFIEITTKQVAYNIWIESDEIKIEESLKRILIKDNKSKGRVVKLQEAIQKVKDGTLKLEGVDMASIKNFIPVVLFEQSPPMHRRLWQFYDRLLTENGVSDRKFLDDLDFWDIEGIEMLLGDVETDKTLPQILKEKEDAGYFKDSVRNFYIIKRNHFDKPSLVKEAFKLATSYFTKILFSKTIKK